MAVSYSVKVWKEQWAPVLSRRKEAEPERSHCHQPSIELFWWIPAPQSGHLPVATMALAASRRAAIRVA
jgi:hypothetical protein